MNYININPGIKRGLKQPFTIMMKSRIFFLTHDEFNGAIEWNMLIDDTTLKQEVEQILKSYLTNQ
jgi:hypothetical protein